MAGLRLKRNYTDGQPGCYVRSHSKTARELIAFIANSAHALRPTSAEQAQTASYTQAVVCELVVDEHGVVMRGVVMVKRPSLILFETL